MKLKISLLTKILNENLMTFYLMYKSKETGKTLILPIEIPSMLNKEKEDTYIRTLKALECKIISLNIYLYLEGRYYVYLKIESKNNVFDINTSIENALNILNNIPNLDIFIEEEIIVQEGINLDKEILNYLDT